MQKDPPAASEPALRALEAGAPCWRPRGQRRSSFFLSVGVKSRGAAGGGSERASERSARTPATAANFTEKSTILFPAPHSQWPRPLPPRQLLLRILLPDVYGTHTRAHKSPVFVHTYVLDTASDIRLIFLRDITALLEEMQTNSVVYFCMLTGRLTELLTRLFLCVTQH